MRKLVTALCALVFLSSCDDELKLVSRDFSVTLKSIDVGTAVVGKPVNCTLTISDLDPDNGDQILTRFEVGDKVKTIHGKGRRSYEETHPE